MTNGLSKKKCVPCEEGASVLKGEKLAELRDQLNRNWRIVNDHHLEREFQFANFSQALAFTNVVGDLAEREGHHPDIWLAWGRVKLKIWTHKIGGLTESDFILAAKIDQLTS